MIRATRSLVAAVAVALLSGASQAHAQNAFRGDCEQARRFADSVAFKASYRGVQRMTPQAADPCGRDVVAIYDLKRRNESNANYDLVGRYYYLWPDNAACREEVHDRLAGVARITQEVRPNGLLCEVQLHLDFDVAEDEKYGPNRFSKLITLVGADTSRFAATAPGETGGTVFYEAPAHTVDRAAGPADENSDVVTDRAEAPPPAAANPYTPGRRQFFDRRLGRFYYYDPLREAYFWENGEPRD
ncbi:MULTISPECIES: hypothetical protein [unclassified Caulobacter]|uniref:hypothetical protein n=1 Tax=unclassified Caulobacter TaxID=2648921 RepID=UPI0006FCF006|nr:MULTISPECIES: hypothetical protein [unclassified Caulobacter]KQV55124.1 hypothetical protein ASC62_21025 [Caulobacter sp. Root342]KQV63688.1 hypothetical protein ASC70_21620 [Caulobacter sp. Root343]